MKTRDIVENLLTFSREYEWQTVNGFVTCIECKGNPAVGHKEDCKYVETKQAAAEYLRIMNGSGT